MNKKTYLWIWILVVLLLVVGFVWKKTHLSAQIWCAKNTCFTLEIADTPQKRSVGLMFRTALKSGHGMVFIFSSMDQHPFRMKNTSIPLDILWIDDKYNIVHIQKALPCEQDHCPIYISPKKARYVIELKEGTAQQLGLQAGDGIRPKE